MNNKLINILAKYYSFIYEMMIEFIGLPDDCLMEIFYFITDRQIAKFAFLNTYFNKSPEIIILKDQYSTGFIHKYFHRYTFKKLLHCVEWGPFNNYIIPKSVTEVNIYWDFKKDGYPDLNTDDIPDHITHLTFGEYFNKPLGKLPKSLTHLTLGICFDQIVNNLPDTLKFLKFGYAFNKDLGDLPNSIEYLEFGYKFNKSIKQFPNNLKLIIIDKTYNYLHLIPKNIKVVYR